MLKFPVRNRSRKRDSLHSLMRWIAGLSALLVIPFPFAQPAVSAQKQPPTTQQEGQPVTMTVTVTNGRDELVSALTKEDFVVLSDKTPQKITYFSAEDSPASIGILFDASLSMNFRSSDTAKIEGYKDALRQFFKRNNPSNEYFLIGFNQQPQLLMDWTSDTGAILDRFSVARFKGKTAFFDACYLGIEKVSHGKYDKHAIILISDGQDNESSYSRGQVSSLLRQLNVLVYSINLSEDNAGSSLADEGQNILNELSRLSGGMTFYRNENRRLPSNALSSIFALIADQLHHQYIIGFISSTKPTKDQWHRIRVEVRGDPADQRLRGLTIRSRESY